MAIQNPYGVTETEAQQQLDAYLHDTLQEPHAALANLHVEDGRWQADVNRSQRGIRVVFLLQHGGQIQPGFMDDDAHPTGSDAHPEELRDAP